jgi:DNA-binding NtrC family response regulator
MEWPERAARCEERWVRLAIPALGSGVSERAGAAREHDSDRPAGSTGAVAAPSAPAPRPHPVRVRAVLQEAGFLTGDRRVLEELAPLLLLAPSPLPVLILGESGTGKEVLARAVHRWSRLRGEFVPIHCGAIPRDLLESELFGHARGAFTGASADKPGLIEASDGGTLFLDEIGEMGMEAQMKMLRVLESGEVRRLGDLQSRRTAIRLVAATHRDLESEIAAGRFRLDLYHRIHGVVVRLRPLRERRGDVPILAARLLSQGGAPLRLSSEALAHLLAYDWPGNVRELRAVLLRAAHLARALGRGVVPPEFLGLGAPARLSGWSSPVWESGSAEADAAEDDASDAEEPRRDGCEAPAHRAEAIADACAAEPGVGPAGGLDAYLEGIERRCIVRALDEHGWNRTRAARSLGDMSRTTLLSKMKRLGIAPRDNGDDPEPA